MVSVDAVKHHEKRKRRFRVQELCEQGGGPRLALILHHILPPSLVSHAVSADVKHQEKNKFKARAVSGGRLAWTLISHPILSQSLAIRLRFLWTQSTM